MTRYDCDGSGPHGPGEIRQLPLGGDGNLLLCRACCSRELAWRKGRNDEMGVENATLRYALPQWSSLKTLEELS